jgi:hypothetical protein
MAKLDLAYMEKSILALDPIEQMVLLKQFKQAISLKERRINGVEIGPPSTEALDIVDSVLGLRVLAGEDRVCAVFDFLIKSNQLAEFESAPVSFEREFAVSGMRIDRLVRHEDGSVTAVEIKPRGVMRDMSHGIGQALLYAAALVRSGIDSVRPALFIPGPKIDLLAEAARIGGVQYIHTDCSVASIEISMELLKWIEE